MASCGARDGAVRRKSRSRAVQVTAPALRAAAALLAAALVTVLCAGCRVGAPTVNFAPGASVLRIAEADDIPTLDPAAGYDTVSWTFEQMIFDTLVRYGSSNLKLVPDAAASWEVSPDATRFVFHLRHDVVFTNGRAVAAADFKYAIERVIDPRTQSKGMEYYREISGAAVFAAHRVPSVAGIETPDAYTIVFRLKHPDPLFVDKLAMPFAAAVPHEVVKRWGADFSRHVVGSGPFKLKQWIGGQRLVLVKNPRYFVKGKPRLDAIDVAIGVSQELQWLRFEAGELDISAIPPAEFPYVMRTARLRRLTLHEVTVATDYLGMNCQMAPFTDVRVRRAFNYAIDKRKLVELLNGRGVVAGGVMPPNLPGYDPAVESYPLDPKKARELLETAHLRLPLRPTLWLIADQTMLMLGQSIQQDLALVGVEVRLKPVAWAPLLEAVRQPRTVALVLLGWEADFPDPENFLAVLLSKKQWGANNDTFYDNPRVDTLLAEAAPLTDLARRYQIYREAERIVLADAPWVPLFHPVAYAIRQPWVHGYRLNPMRPSRLDTVWLGPRTATRTRR